MPLASRDLRAVARRASLLVTVALLALPAAAGAQSGLLKKIKAKATEKAAERAVEKAVDRATGAPADSAAAKPEPPADRGRASSAGAQRAAADTAASAGAPAAPASRGRGMSARRSTPLDPTLLESPGYRPPAGAAAPHAAGPATPGSEYDRFEWHGTPQSLAAFASSVPPITDATIERFVRARAAMIAEAQRVKEMRERKVRNRPWLDSLNALKTRPLADDERVPLLVSQGYMKVYPSAGRDFERRFDAVVERELGGAMTRLQFYQMLEMIDIYLSDGGRRQAQGPGRDLTAAERAALARHRDELARLVELQHAL